jgi:glycosyltransferase involved in cell wall biosynthesis
LVSSKVGRSTTERKGICFIGPDSPFVKQDINILNRYYNLELITPPKNKKYWPSTIFKIMRSQSKRSAYYCWFAGWHSLFPIIFNYRKLPVIVVVGGYDAANVPEIDYGAFRVFKERIAARFVLRHATKICVVDGSLKKDVMLNAGIDGSNVLTIPTGYDSSYFKPGAPKEDLVITVGAVTAAVSRRKGFEYFIEAARAFPDVKFALVGKWGDGHIDELRSNAPINVIFTGYVTDDQLLEWYQRAKVYCQLSRYEGLPNALCEAMLCECVPVGTNHCGIPTAIGDTGFYAGYGDVKGTVESVSQALLVYKEKGALARQRIASGFKIETREKALVTLIDDSVTNTDH